MSFSDALEFFKTDQESRRIIVRWLECPGVNDMWDKLVRANESYQKDFPHPLHLDPNEFIQVVLSARHGADKLIAHESSVRDRFARLKASLLVLIKLAESPRDIEDAFEHSKVEREQLDRSIYDWGSGTAVSRNDTNGSRTRKAFKMRLDAYLLRRCGAVMNEITTQLMDIVFDKVHSEDQGRIARRPTTKGGRGR